MATKKTKPIDYEKLAADLADAKEAALKVTHIKGDGGSSNGDYVTLTLPRALLAKVQAAATAAGLRAGRRYAGAFYVWPPNPDRAQGYINTARAEAVVRVLKARGWNASMSYFTD
jgi:hypothetical protein